MTFFIVELPLVTLTHRKAFGFNQEIQGQVPRFLQKSALQK